MALIKYSIGGPITTIKDENSVEKREEAPTNNQPSYIIVCGKCQIQHMILHSEQSRTCSCGNNIKLGDLS